MSNTVPDAWTEVTLGNHAYIKARIGWRGLSSTEYTNSGVYLIAGTHIRGSKIEWDRCDHIDDFRYEESPEIQLREHDVVISKDGTIGRLGYVENLPGPATINGTMMLIRPEKNFYPKFIYFYLQGDKFQKIIKEKVSGSSVPHIFQRDMVTLSVPCPPLPEQQRIAAILSSVDDVIEKIRAQIEKLKDLKMGMMQELLKKGVGHTEFKDSAVGRIPVSWTVSEIGEIAEIKGGKRLPKGAPFSDVKTPYPYIRISDFSNGSISLRNIKYVRPSDREKIKRYTISKNDLYVSIAGIYLGLFGEVPEILDGSLLTENAAKLVFKNISCINKTFVGYMCQSEFVQKQLLREKGIGAGVPKLALFRIAETHIVLPPKEEQDKIGSYLLQVDTRIQKSFVRLDAIKKLRKALMQDLLTGKVRVNVDHKESAVA